jgi:hypothetical protein
MTEGEIRRAEREINALYERVHETVRQRARSAAQKREWQDACRAFHSYRASAFNLWRAEVLEQVRAGGESERSDALLLLEVDPWFFRSGYLKQKLLRALKNAHLAPQEVARLEGICLAVVDGRPRREFREYCRVAARVGTARLKAGLMARLATSDTGVRQRTDEMLRYLLEHGAA